MACVTQLRWHLKIETFFFLKLLHNEIGLLWWCHNPKLYWGSFVEVFVVDVVDVVVAVVVNVVVVALLVVTGYIISTCGQ